MDKPFSGIWIASIEKLGPLLPCAPEKWVQGLWIRREGSAFPDSEAPFVFSFIWVVIKMTVPFWVP